MDLTSEDYQYRYKIVKYSAFTTSMISLISVFCVLFAYYRLKNLRNIAFRMVVYLQISDGIVAFSMVLQIFDAIYHPALCKTQAFLGNFGCVSSFFWTSCISTAIYKSSTNKWPLVEPYEKYFLIFSYGFALILSIIPLATDTYDNASYWCWIGVNKEKTVRDAEIILVFFLFLWLAMLYNSYMVYLVLRFFHGLEQALISRYDRHLKKIIWFPLAMIICWLLPSLYRIFQMCGFENFWISWLHAICEGINGFVNTMIYASNRKIRKELRESFASVTQPRNFLREV